MVSFGLKGRVQLAQAAAQPYSAQRSSRNTAQLQQYDAGHAKHGVPLVVSSRDFFGPQGRVQLAQAAAQPYPAQQAWVRGVPSRVVL